MTSGSTGYFEKYYRQHKPSALDTARLMTDRNAYIAFLEAQLDKVSRSCLLVDTMEDRIAKLAAQVIGYEEKLANATRIFTMSEKLYNKESKEFGTFKHEITSKLTTLQESISASQEHEHMQQERQVQWMTQLQDSVEAMRSRVENVQTDYTRTKEELSTRLDHVSGRLSESISQLQERLHTQGLRASEHTNKLVSSIQTEVNQRLKIHDDVMQDMHMKQQNALSEIAHLQVAQRDADARVQRALAPVAAIQHSSEVDRREWRNITGRLEARLADVTDAVATITNQPLPPSYTTVIPAPLAAMPSRRVDRISPPSSPRLVADDTLEPARKNLFPDALGSAAAAPDTTAAAPAAPTTAPSSILPSTHVYRDVPPPSSRTAVMGMYQPPPATQVFVTDAAPMTTVLTANLGDLTPKRSVSAGGRRGSFMDATTTSARKSFTTTSAAAGSKSTKKKKKAAEEAQHDRRRERLTQIYRELTALQLSEMKKK